MMVAYSHVEIFGSARSSHKPDMYFRKSQQDLCLNQGKQQGI